jgi:hypothetical protein
MNLQALIHLIWILPLLLLVVHIGSPRFLGTIGSTRVRRLLNNMLEKGRYTQMHDIRLPAGGGSIHVDHLLVSQYGIHVIDTIYKKGWIWGTDAQARWRHKVFGSLRQFDNPVYRNKLNVDNVARLLDLPLSRFHPMVVFSGHLGFKNERPANVVEMNSLIGKIRADSRQALTPEDADKALLSLQSSIIRPSALGRYSGWKILRLLLLILLMGSVYFAFGDQLKTLVREVQRHADVSMAPENFDAEGQQKSAAEMWQDSLMCAYSVDSDRCACYDASGAKAKISPQKCKDLAERGSVLNR